MCGGGGGGGNSAEREEERQRQQQKAINQVNALFGIVPDEGPSRDAYTERVKRYDNSQDDYVYEDAFDRQAYQQAVARHNALQQQARANQAERSELYSDVSGDVSEYLTDDLDRQKTDAERVARFALARRGVRGGSSDLDTQEDLLENYNEGVMKVQNRAADTAARLRTSDEDARLNLINRIQSGMNGNAAIQSAQTQMRNNVDSIKSGAMAQSLGGLFDRYADLTVEQNAEKGRQMAYGNSNRYRSYIPNSNKTYSGRVS